MYRFYLIALCFTAGFASPARQTKIVDLLLNQQNYDKNVRPNIGREAVNVSVTIYIIANNVIEETKSAITFESLMYFRRKWNDSRLSFNGETIYGSTDLLEKIWTPDLFFPNSIDVRMFDRPTPNVFVRITPNGELMVSERLALKWKCLHAVNPDEFPCDTVRCAFEIESYGFDMKTINLIPPEKNALGIDDGSTENFAFKGSELKLSHVQLKSGNYSRYSAVMTFKRNLHDAKYTIMNDNRYPKFYSSIPLKPKFEKCE